RVPVRQLQRRHHRGAAGTRLPGRLHRRRCQKHPVLAALRTAALLPAAAAYAGRFRPHGELKADRQRKLHEILSRKAERGFRAAFFFFAGVQWRSGGVQRHPFTVQWQKNGRWQGSAGRNAKPNKETDGMNEMDAGKMKDDLKLKLMLVLVRDRRAMQGRLRSVRFMREYGALPDQLGAITLRNMSDDERAALAAGIGIRSKPAGAKSDLYLNDVGYRIQALALHPTEVADGLGMDGLRAVCRKAGVGAEQAEEVVDAFREYWRRRQAGELPDGMPVDGEGSPLRHVE